MLYEAELKEIEERHLHLECIACLFIDNLPNQTATQRCHAISRANTLNLIADRQNSVIGPTEDDRAAVQNNLNIYKFTKIGTRKHASVFYGFCNKHDTSLFETLDKNLFEDDLEYCNKLAIRSLAHEAYKYRHSMEVKKDTLEFYRKIWAADPRLPLAEKHLAPDLKGNIRNGTIVNLLKRLLFPEPNPLLMSVKHLVVEVDDENPVQSCGAALARYSPIGRELWTYLRNKNEIDRYTTPLIPPIEVISTCRSENGVCIVISLFSSALSDWDTRWIDDFKDIDPRYQLKYLYCHLLYATRTTYFNPNWHSSQSDQNKQTMLEIANGGLTASGYFDKITPAVFRSIKGSPLRIEVISNQ